MKTPGVTIAGIGRALPKTCLTNDDMTQFVETSDEWITGRTGIRTRYLCREEDQMSLAIEAGREALEDAGIDPSQVSLCLVATATPLTTMPSTACMAAKALGLPEMCAAFDFNAACSGFIYGMKTAAAWLAADAAAGMHVAAGNHATTFENAVAGDNAAASANAVADAANNDGPYALLICAEQFSRILDFTDRSTCVLFGDAAGAVVLKHDPTKQMYTTFGTRGDDKALHCPGPGLAGRVTMDGPAVFRFAVEVMEKILKTLEVERGLSLAEVGEIVCHQANKRIIASTARHLKLDVDRFFMNLDRFGNTSAASIPLALYDLKKMGRLTPGKTIYCAGFGAGLTYGGLSLDL
ncbi:MAG: 3-oxoacyl-[acyl-carrier-protein] synthase III C-terminal domain-containing protein [Lachnospiraceae bacterium]|nr:3-oxoacyl-[acyl-carrier-protein] synthase III C-terminal domain-containing protein [Lachnospiraceae bacterium]